MVKRESISDDKHVDFQEELLFSNDPSDNEQLRQIDFYRIDDESNTYKEDKTDMDKQDTSLKFSASKDSAKNNKTSEGESSSIPEVNIERNEAQKYNETRIPILEEKLKINKVQSYSDLTLIKEPVIETTTIEVPIVFEELTIQRRRLPVNETGATQQAGGEGPVQSNTEIKIPLMKEEIEISKQPYVKEEVVIKKKPVTETRTVTEEVKSEKVKVKRGAEEKVEEEIA
jgi:uncharacterized protein (TIGR02271 family)